MPRLYFEDNAPINPQQGDLIVRKATNELQEFNGSTWGSPRFTALTVDSGGLTVTAGTTSLGGGLQPAAGFASTNATGPGWYIPGEAGVPTGNVASLGKRVAEYYDTTNNRACYHNGGSWFATPSLTLV